jgi:glycosyltransferase 2 family protein
LISEKRNTFVFKNINDDTLKESQDNNNTATQSDDEKKFLQSMRLSRMILPISIGILAVGYLLYRQFDLENFKQIEWTTKAISWVVLGIFLLILRHFAYALRMRAITEGKFSWLKCMQLVALWEFSGALTPTSKGGPFVMMFVLTKEKLSAGKTAAAVLYTIVCDAGFMVLTLPLLLLFFGPPMLYPGMNSFKDVGLASGTFFFTYFFMASYWLAFVFFLFFKPQFAQFLLNKIGKISFLKKYQATLSNLGEEFILAAKEVKSQKIGYHAKFIFGTIGAWTLKFAMINCLILAVSPNTPLDGFTQLFIYARMVAMYIIMAFSPTPGGAGLAEVAMAKFISDFVPVGLGVVVALMWRGLAYYGYLILGAFIVPAWIADKLKK